MAVEIKISVPSVKDKFKFSDVTGVYNVTTNPTGYGAPNIAVSDFNGCTIVVTFPDGVTTVSLNPFPTMPSSDPTDVFEITAEDLGVDSLVPGVYTFDYNLTSSLSEDGYTVSKKILYYWPVQCCISKKVKSMSFITSSKEEVCEVAYSERQLKAAIAAYCSGNIVEAQNIIDVLWEKCGCCC